MKRRVVSLAVLILMSPCVLARLPGSCLHVQPPRPGERPDEWPDTPVAPTRQPTVWFGGDNGSGVAYLNGVWDFDTPGSNGFQGCTSRDETANPETYFGWVTAASFVSQGDSCVPMIGGTAGMLWCGIGQGEADQRDFVAGMGYQNLMCQRAFSPRYAGFQPSTQAIDLEFSYFNHSEPDVDRTCVYVLCYDSADELIEEHLVAALDGVIGSHQLPAFYDEGIEVPAGTLPPATIKVQLELRFIADGSGSDEDGLWDSPCGPFAADDVSIRIGYLTYDYDFETSPQGWTFSRCAGKGAWMSIVHDTEYTVWMDELGLTCPCTLVGNAVAFVATTCPNGPGLVPGLKEQFETGPVPRGGYLPPTWNTVVVEHDHFVNFPPRTGAHYRPGWRKYPYTTEVNPTTHWSGRQGQNVWYYVTDPYCGPVHTDLSAMADSPLPAAWDSVKYTYEIYCSCDAFATPVSVCEDEGCTGGAPVLDNLRIGISQMPDLPPIGLIAGGLFMDGFGEGAAPGGLPDPLDRCNVNISFDLSMDDPEENDWHGDSSVVCGPLVSSNEDRFLCELCFRVARCGPRQHLIPEYNTWKARLASDPEDNYVCILMDSLETQNHTQVWTNKFWSYFHENAVGFGGLPDYGAQNEILPDGIWVPGTRIEYYYRSYWYNDGAPPADYYVLGYPPALEIEFLPGMELVPGEEWHVQWPSVLYVDAFNRGVENYMRSALAQLEIPFDQFDFTDNSSNYNTSLRRDLGGTVYNPGGYGNNGCTMEKLCGYRLILWSNGSLGAGSCEPEDFQLFDSWLSTTNLGLADIRRGIVFDGDRICEVMAGETNPLALDFCHDVLGATLWADAYRDHNEDPAYCVYLEPADSPQFGIDEPGDALYGNGCPQEFHYNVLDVQPGVSNVTGNLDYWSYEGTGQQEYVSFAQVIRVCQQEGVANWRSVVNGFSLHHLTERGCGGQPCSSDSVCISAGVMNLLDPMLEWLADGGAPFEKWWFGWVGTVRDPVSLPLGQVNYLCQSRPNPFHTRATVHFSLASHGKVTLLVFDVSGRLVKTLWDGAAQAGANSLVWDGTDSNGDRVGGGVFWVQMTTHDGYASGKKLLVLR